MDGVPLAGCRVLLTRPADQAEPWRRPLEAAGAVVIAYPTIEVGPPDDFGPMDAAFQRLTSYQWLVFTSVNAVRFSCARWPAGLASDALAAPRVAAVGAQTARALESFGIRVACLPELESQDGLLAALGDLPAGTRILFPQAVGGRDTLASTLRSRGCTVDVVPASQTVPRAGLPPPPAFDVATFASPSALRALVELHGRAPLLGRPVVVIGATTAAAAAELGLRCETADHPRIEDVIAAIVRVHAAPPG